VTTATAGFFRCEVSGEGPSFPSVSDGGHLTVVIPPKRKPEIFGGVSDGNVELNCTTDASRPAAQIKWFVNGAQVRSLIFISLLLSLRTLKFVIINKILF
jgi:hypothetical protein